MDWEPESESVAAIMACICLQQLAGGVGCQAKGLGSGLLVCGVDCYGDVDSDVTISKRYSCTRLSA